MGRALGSMERCEKIRSSLSIHDLGVYITNFPEVLLGNRECAMIMEMIPKLIRKHNERVIEPYFMKAIINCNQIRELGWFSDTARHRMEDSERSYRDAPLEILRLYLRTLADNSGGTCFDHDHLRQAHEDTRGLELSCDFYEFMGIIYLIAESQTGDLFWKTILHTIMNDGAHVSGFLRVFADCTVSLFARDKACDALARIWLENAINENPENPSDIEYPFNNKCRAFDSGWLTSKLPSQASPELIEDCIHLFVALGNAINNRFACENFFFEYAAMINTIYPLDKIRFNIAERYERYFSYDVYSYMGDLMSLIVETFGQCTNYRDDPKGHLAYVQIAKKIESIVINIRYTYPDVDQRVVRCFFKDISMAYGRGFRGASEGIMIYADPIITEVYKRSMEAVEADLHALDTLQIIAEATAALEAETDEGSGDRGGATGNLTSRAKTGGNAKEAMQAAERKIYNAWHKYKEGEQKVDNVLKKGIDAIKRAIIGDQNKVIIEGKSFSPIGFLKKAIVTVGIFNYSKIALILGLIVAKVMKGKAKKSERRKIEQELEEELVMVREKIQDAKGDGNREAKYALMRTEQAYVNALKRIKFGMGAEPNREALQAHTEAQRNTSGYRG